MNLLIIARDEGRDVILLLLFIYLFIIYLFIWDFSLQKKCLKSGERLIRGYTKFDFTVDERKGRLNPSRDKNYGKHRRRKAEKFRVTPSGASTSLTSRINGMTTHTHTHVGYC